MALRYGDMRSAAARRDWKEIDQVLADWPENYFEEGEKYARDCGWLLPDEGPRNWEWMAGWDCNTWEDVERAWMLVWPAFHVIEQEHDELVWVMRALEEHGQLDVVQNAMALRSVIWRIYPTFSMQSFDQREDWMASILGHRVHLILGGQFRPFRRVLSSIRRAEPTVEQLAELFGSMGLVAGQALVAAADFLLDVGEAADLTANIMAGFDLTDDQRAVLAAVSRQSQFTEEAALSALRLYDSVPSVGLPKRTCLDADQRFERDSRT